MISQLTGSAAPPTVVDVCERVGITRQAYYQSRRRARRRQAEADRVLELVRDERKYHPRMGTRKLYRKIKADMRQEGISMGRDRLFDLLRAEDLLVKPRKQRGPATTNGAWSRWGNSLEDVELSGPNQAWVADITYLETLDGFCYLALISDAYSRKIVGWNLSDSLELEGALQALKDALRERPGWTRLIHHSDRGSQYRSRAYIEELQEAGCTISMTEKDHCAENAQAERLNGILKDEYLLDQMFPSIRLARRAADQAIKLYNNDRPHLSLDYKAPNDVHRATSSEQ